MPIIVVSLYHPAPFRINRNDGYRCVLAGTERETLERLAFDAVAQATFLYGTHKLLKKVLQKHVC
jgi:hypothetical protein